MKVFNKEDNFGILVIGLITILCMIGVYAILTIADNEHKEEMEKIHLSKIEDKVLEMRVTGYIPTGNKTALMEDVIVGYSAAISPKCMHLLSRKVYIDGYGIRRINDLTASWIDKEFEDCCTIDISVPTIEEANKVGNSIRKVVILDESN